MILVADSGSTKTDWAIVDKDTTLRINTQGINPVHQNCEAILKILYEELLPHLEVPEVEAVYYYGSGVRPELEEQMADVLHGTFPRAKTIEPTAIF